MFVRKEDVGELIGITPAAMPFIPRPNPNTGEVVMGWNAIEVTLRAVEEDSIVVQSGDLLWRVAVASLCSYAVLTRTAVTPVEPSRIIQGRL